MVIRGRGNRNYELTAQFLVTVFMSESALLPIAKKRPILKGRFGLQKRSMVKRITKQLVFAFFFFSVFWSASTLLSFAPWQYLSKISLPEQATCGDGIRDQGELDIDCGGPCAACVIKPEALKVTGLFVLPAEEGYYDILAIVSNPNTKEGAVEAPFSVFLKDGSGSVVSRYSGTTYVLPTQERYIVLHAIDAQGRAIATAELEFREEEIKWVELSEYRDADLAVNDLVFNYLGSGPEYAEVSGIAWNRSTFDYDTIEIVAVLFDDIGVFIGARSLEMRTLRGQEQRFFRVSWRKPFSREVERFTVVPYTNLLADANYLRRYGVPERFQELR